MFALTKQEGCRNVNATVKIPDMQVLTVTLAKVCCVQRSVVLLISANMFIQHCRQSGNQAWHLKSWSWKAELSLLLCLRTCGPTTVTGTQTNAWPRFCLSSVQTVKAAKILVIPSAVEPSATAKTASFHNIDTADCTVSQKQGFVLFLQKKKMRAWFEVKVLFQAAVCLYDLLRSRCITVFSPHKNATCFCFRNLLIISGRSSQDHPTSHLTPAPRVLRRTTKYILPKYIC